jgi:hypothetical protein
MHKRIVTMGLILLILLISLACSTITAPVERVSDAKETVESVVTEAVGLATQGAPLIATAEAFATDSPGLIETVEAVVTENPGIVETVQAVATEGFSMGSGPDDIPVVDDSTVHNFFGSDTLVSYSTSQDFQTVVDFYKSEMPANGWEADSSMSFELKNTATLTWNQTNRQAIIIITVNPADQSTVVAITIQPR